MKFEAPGDNKTPAAPKAPELKKPQQELKTLLLSILRGQEPSIQNVLKHPTLFRQNPTGQATAVTFQMEEFEQQVDALGIVDAMSSSGAVPVGTLGVSPTREQILRNGRNWMVVFPAKPVESFRPEKRNEGNAVAKFIRLLMALTLLCFASALVAARFIEEAPLDAIPWVEYVPLLIISLIPAVLLIVAFKLFALKKLWAVLPAIIVLAVALVALYGQDKLLAMHLRYESTLPWQFEQKDDAYLAGSFHRQFNPDLDNQVQAQSNPEVVLANLRKLTARDLGEQFRQYYSEEEFAAITRYNLQQETTKLAATIAAENSEQIDRYPGIVAEQEPDIKTRLTPAAVLFYVYSPLVKVSKDVIKKNRGNELLHWPKPISKPAN